MELIDVPPGLSGVAVTATSVGDVLGEEGLYHYRGRSAVELARTATFEDVAALVLDETGEPAIGDGSLPEAVAALVDRVDLRSGLSLLADAVTSGPITELDPATRRADAVRLISAFPTLVASVHHGRVRAPRPDLGHVANHLWMLTGEVDPIRVQALETYAVLTMDHGFNSSTFAARVVASTGADLGACLVAAYGALTGPRHGAVQLRVLEMLDEVGAPEQAEEWMKATIAARNHVMGFGHAVYKVGDPRAAVLREVAAQVAPERTRVAIGLEEAGERVFAGRRLGPNVDLYAAVVLEGCGLEPELMTPTFAVARIVGWCAHVLEQATERKVIRPAAHYVGPPPDLAG